MPLFLGAIIVLIDPSRLLIVFLHVFLFYCANEVSENQTIIVYFMYADSSNIGA